MQIVIVKFETRDADLLDRFKQYTKFGIKFYIIKRTQKNDCLSWEWEFWFNEEKQAEKFYDIIIYQNEMPDQILNSMIEYSDVL